MIRPAQQSDLNEILTIYDNARYFMRDNGNGEQWGESHPPLSMLIEDIEIGQLYVYATTRIVDSGFDYESACGRYGYSNEIIHGVFAFIIGEDPTYNYIEDGEWLNDEKYGAVHRIASTRKIKGVFGECINFCKNQITNIRIDTHEKNQIMQHLLTKHGFKECGIIYIPDGSPRIAYQWEEENA